MKWQKPNDNRRVKMSFDIDEWCDLFKGLKVEQMSDDLTHLMVACMMGGINQESMNDLFMYQVVTGRADAIGLVMDQKLKNFMACLCQSPGDSTMYLSFLRNEGTHMSMEQFAELLPNGYPTRDEMEILWDAQKDKDAPMGNALDANLWA
jgi:hypothetical protein